MSSAWHAEGLHCAEAVGLSLRSYEAQERLRSFAAEAAKRHGDHCNVALDPCHDGSG